MSEAKEAPAFRLEPPSWPTRCFNEASVELIWACDGAECESVAAGWSASRVCGMLVPESLPTILETTT